MTQKIAKSNQLPDYTADGVSVYHFDYLVLRYTEKTKKWEGEYIRWDENEDDWVTDRPLLPGEIPVLLAKFQPITKENIHEYLIG